MDSKKHTALTGAKAVVSRKVGGKFSIFEGWCKGKNLILVKDKLIVQSWRASDWKKGEDSTVTFKFDKIKTGTLLTLTHGAPTKYAPGLKAGWREYYWQSLKKKFD